ncbi:MAG: membrane dipeptidase [Alphaproteobacteria bacterium]|jgi:membrane dipeptidase|nr:membrane dipeptidase [Alphaproteobacteria bacterium]MBT4017578.1 membrane dipeptidase [Alphaproteobacteria bacterium]MBT4966097.1 membrane dipeptidase [Alphaproteobacteria bacterium]MBT5159443.1 membrane dipeptidase [Alphaproteobacteria bacterium]MBT5920354.1 membrane dipeptidase [Alphaproteobacteria bacterium]
MELYENALVWDDHAGFESKPEANLDQLEAWRKAGVNYLSVNAGYDVRPWDNTVKTLASFHRQLAGMTDKYVIVKTVEDIANAKAAGKLAVTFDIEGMESLNDSLDMVSMYYDLGVKHMLFAYNLNNKAGGGCHDTDIGLSTFGRNVVEEMNRVGMVVDCSHSGYRTTMEAMEISKDPVVFSHSNPRALVDQGRNILDEQIKACAATGGVIGINGVQLFLGGTTTVEAFVDHVIYTVELVGAQHVGMGLDYFEGEDEISGLTSRNPAFWPKSEGYVGDIGCMGLDVLPRATELMLERGLSEEDVIGILGGNFLSVAERVWK